ncbi:MAG TPA: acetate uptake transporter [Jatrophihabitantaceae bacterium]
MSAIADPGPLGLAGFALTTFVLSVFNTGMIKTGDGVVLGLALAYGGIAQLAAGMWEFVKGNTFGAVAFASYGGFWISFWWLLNHLPADTKDNDLHHGLGVFLLAWAIFTFYMFIASLRTTAAVAAVLLALTLTYVLLAIGQFTMNPTEVTNTAYKAGGWVGLVTAFLAWYASFAAVANFTFKRAVVPTVPLEGGRP